MSSELRITAPCSRFPFSSSVLSSTACSLILLLYLLCLFSPLIITERDTAVLPTLGVSRICRHIISVSHSSHRYVLSQTDDPSQLLSSQTIFLRTEPENLWSVCPTSMHCATFAAPITNQQFTEKRSVGRLFRVLLGHVCIYVYSETSRIKTSYTPILIKIL